MRERRGGTPRQAVETLHGAHGRVLGVMLTNGRPAMPHPRGA